MKKFDDPLAVFAIEIYALACDEKQLLKVTKKIAIVKLWPEIKKNLQQKSASKLVIF